MANEPILIDPSKIVEKVEWHRGEISRLNALLDNLDSLREFAADPIQATINGNGHARGRIARDNPFTEKLREFIGRKSGQFTYAEVKEILGNSERRDLMASAIETLEGEGLLKIIQMPMGRRPGIYEKMEVK